jgi:ribonuclease P protein subunit POP4
LTPITPGNIIRHELIGLDVKVVDDSNPHHISISGRVIDETRNTLVIRQRGEAKRIAKRNALFLFRLPVGDVEVKGAALVGRPEDRVKRKLRRRW